MPRTVIEMAGARHDLSLVVAWQRATHQLLRAIDAELEDLDLTPGEVNALACFLGGESAAVGELATRSGQRPSTLTGVLDRLEKRGLVERRPNPADRRSSLAVLTPAGRAAARRVDAAIAAVEGRLPATVRRAGAALGAVEASTLSR